MIRLNKLLAERGIAARRKCDALIEEGHVRVNGEVVRELGTKVEPDRDRVLVHGRPLPRRAELRYFVLNKPVGVITTLDDPEGRRTVRELMPPGSRLFPVGRLDADTSGLLLLTNDGELAHKLMHPRYGVEKVYRVRLDREPTAGQLERLERGVEFEPGLTSGPARAYRAKTGFEAIMVEIAIHEGRHRQVRKMFEAVGLPVRGLHRIAYGPVRLGPMARGMWRELSAEEVAKLKSSSARPTPRMARPAFGEKRRTAAPTAAQRRPTRPVRGEARAPIAERRAAPGQRPGRASRPTNRRAGAQGRPSSRATTQEPRNRRGSRGPSRPFRSSGQSAGRTGRPRARRPSNAPRRAERAPRGPASRGRPRVTRGRRKS